MAQPLEVSMEENEDFQINAFSTIGDRKQAYDMQNLSYSNQPNNSYSNPRNHIFSNNNNGVPIATIASVSDNVFQQSTTDVPHVQGFSKEVLKNVEYPNEGVKRMLLRGETIIREFDVMYPTDKWIPLYMRFDNLILIIFTFPSFEKKTCVLFGTNLP